MSEPTPNLPVLRELRTTQELVNPVTDSWAEVLPQVAELARSICTTPFVPDALRNNVAGTTAAILYNREIGLAPMTGLQAVHVIKGKVGISAEMMRALVFAAGHEIWFEETNTSFCEISGRRAGSDRVTTVKYSETDAKTAGLFSNDNYKKNPRRMYQARATSELCALIFADIIRGMVSSEELYAEEEAGDSITAKAEGGTTVERKTRAPRKASPAALEPANEVPLPGETQTDDGAVPPADAPTASGPSTAPSSPMPPLPGESPQTDDGAGPPPAQQARANASPAPSSSLPPLPGEEDMPPEEDLPPESDEITDPQRGKLFALMSEHGLASKDQQIGWMSKNLGREITSRAQVNKDDAIKLIDLLESTDVATPRPIGRGDLRLLAGIFRELAITDMDERLHIASSVVGRTPMKEGAPSPEGLTAVEGKTLLDALARCKSRDHVEALVQMAEQERAQGGDQDA